MRLTFDREVDLDEIPCKICTRDTALCPYGMHFFVMDDTYKDVKKSDEIQRNYFLSSCHEPKWHFANQTHLAASTVAFFCVHVRTEKLSM